MKPLTHSQLEQLHRVAHGSIDRDSKPEFTGTIPENRLVYLGYVSVFEEGGKKFIRLTDQGKAYLRGVLV